MKKKVFSLMMTLLLAFMGVAKADVVTIGDGTSTTYVTPYNSLWGYSFVEQLFTADEIGTAGTITAISFNMQSTSTQTNSVDVFMKNVSRTGFSSASDYETVTASDMVFSGTVTFSSGWTTITLDTPFAYDGTSSLMIGMHEKTSGYSTRYFYYTSAADKVVTFHSDSADPNPYDLGSYSGNSYVSPNRANIQIDITAGGGGAGAGDQIFAIQDGEIVDTVFVGERPNGCWMEPFTFQIRNTGAAVTVTNLDWTPNTYFTLADDELLPFALGHNAEQDIALNTGDAQGNTDWQMVAIYGTGRTAAVWNIHVDAYDPAIPDVVEMAYDFGTIAAGFSYQGVPSQITPTELHNDYTLPFPEIEEGVDAVYKFTVATDMILNAYVDTLAENGKVALYTEDFYGEGGPMADNNYTGLNLNGGSGGSGGGGAAFQAQIGEGTTTSTYFPFHTLWNYSLAENLFLASELTAAGVTTAPMTSLSWYVSSTTCTTSQNSISIWMANVSDATLTSTSHTTAGMTLVYTGNSVLPTAGEWNEFVFNAGNFAWDGHSNILILCQRNNGSWQGSISWQTHNPGFAGMSYAYNDNNAYDATTQTYSMTTSSTNRANIIFKGGNRENTRDVVLNEGFEGGSMPAGWTSEGDGSWTVGTGDYSTGTGANTGSYNAMITHSSTEDETYLVTPAMDLSNASEATLSFAYVNRSWAGDTDEFGVYYRVNGGTWNELFYTSTAHSTWTASGNITLTGFAANYQLGFLMVDKYGYGVGLDDVVVNATMSGGGTPTPGPTPTPTPGVTVNVSAGPVIENLGLTPGTYYLVASATQADYDVFINVDQMPCPAVNAEGYAFNPTPADDEAGVEPASVTLRWTNPQYATEWRLVFGSTYYPEPEHPQTIITDWSSTMATSYTVRNLWNNTNYFWRIEYRNDACMEGVSSPIVGFTTHLNIPTNLTAVDYTVFNDEEIVLNWNAVVDRTYRQYYIYRDGVKIGETTMNNISNTTYTDGPLAYNMGGYVYYVTAVYDEGESAPSDPVTVKVSGRGNVNGHVYEQDGTTGIAGATVTMQGTDEFGDPHTYNFTTNAEGYYTGAVYAGVYNGSAGCDGYQTILEPIQGNPINIAYNQTTSPVDYMLDENFDPVCGVIAEYYPDSLDPSSPYVKVYWGCGLPGGEIIEDFETGDFSMFDWQVDATYPWSITTTNPYEGTYCMKSGGAGVANVVSNMTVTVDIPADGLMSFFGKISCENNWDYGYFYIDGVEKGSYTGAGNWAERTFDITAGTHTFQWRYTKDSSVNSNDDCFYVDYINFYKQPEPPVPGMTYDFDNSTMQGWTSLDADGDGYGWYVASDIMSTGYGHNGSNDCVLSQSYNNSVGVLYPDNYLVSPQVALGGVVTFYACAQDASYAAEHFGVAVSTTSNSNPSAFTMLNEWTMSAKDAPAKRVQLGTANGQMAQGFSRDGNLRAQGNWYQYTVDLSAYAGQTGYVAIRHFNCSDMFYLDVDDITISEPGKGATRAFSHYRVYRTDCYNDGPYTLLDEEHGYFGNTRVLACEVLDTVYIDTYWNDPTFTPAGVYKWGVGVVYEGNRGEEIAGPIHWAAPAAANDNYRVFEGKNVPENNFKSVFSTGDVSDYMPNRGNATVILTAGDVWGDGSGYQMLLDADANTYGTIIPETGALSLNCSGNDAIYGEFEYKIPVNADGNCSTSNIVINNSVSIEIPAGTYDWCVTNPTPGDRIWIAASTGNVGGRENDYVFEEGMVYEFVLSMHGTNDGVDVSITSNPNPPTPPTPTPGAGDLQEPRESEIVWSNCLDKDMYLTDVDITVLLNSADSPEGTTVTLTNLNPGEQELYPVAPITLDGTGYYVWDSFRRGRYVVNVALEGYEPVVDTVDLWNGGHMRYVLIEILYGVENVYVSRTGWAMWDDSHNNPGGGQGGGGGQGDTFTESWDNGLNGWTNIDADGDGHMWYHSNEAGNHSTVAVASHSGAGHVMGESYCNATWAALTPDDYLVSPQQYAIVNGSTLTFWGCAQDESYAAEHFGVAVSTGSNTNASDFTTIQEWTLTAKSAGNTIIGRDGRQTREGVWHQYTCDLSNYAGQNVWIAIRHFNCTDMFIMCLDDAELTTGAKNADEMEHFEYYKVMCTSIDGVPIYNHNTVHPFCQLSTNEPYNAPLVEGEHYLCKVASVYSTGMSAWSEPVEWEYEPCDHWGPVDEVTVGTNTQGNLIEWVFDHGYNPYDPGTGGGGGGGQASFDWYYYDNGVNVDAIGLTQGGSFYWAVMFPAGSYEGHQVSKVSMYDYSANNGNILVYQGGTTAPATLVGQQAYTCTGSEDFVEWTFNTPVTIDPTQNLWIVMNNNNGQYVASACDNTGDANGRWISLDGTDWMDVYNDAGLPYTWMLRAYVGDGAKGNYYGATDNTASGMLRSGSVYNQYSEDGVMLDFHAIKDVYFRSYLLYTLSHNQNFTMIDEEQYGLFIVNPAYEMDNFMEEFESFYANAETDFSLLGKAEITNLMGVWKSSVEAHDYLSIMMDVYSNSSRAENDHCLASMPFCTSDVIEFEAAYQGGTVGEPGPDYGCLSSQPYPSWYHMRIHTAGQFVIHMEAHDAAGQGHDIDYCIWGPFDDPYDPCVDDLTCDKLIDCSYSTASVEDAYLGYPISQHTSHHNSSLADDDCVVANNQTPHVPQVGEYYILCITNFAQTQQTISFTKTEGEGETDCNIVVNTDILGFLITEDGEYLAFAGPDDREYLHEGEYGEHEYCVRPIYPGEMVLPSNNFGWSMGCPVCSENGGQIVCEPGDPIHSELLDSNHIKVWWGTEPAAPVEDWLYYDDGTNEDAIGLQGGGSFYWAIKFPAASLANYGGCSVTKVAYFDYTAHSGVVRIYQGSNGNGPSTNMIGSYNYTANGTEDWVEWNITPASFDNTQDLWIVMNNTDGGYVAAVGPYTGDPNGTMLSIDGAEWYTLDEATGGAISGTWNLRCFVSNQAKGGAEAVEMPLPSLNGGELAHAGMAKGGSFNLNRNRAQIVSYNVYRATEAAGDYVLIGTVTEETAPNYYEYIDSPTVAGTYFYQVTAVYDNDCESEPALAADGSGNNYVYQTTTAEGVDENGGMAIFPNPTKANVTIQAKGMQHITVVSVLGQVVYDADVDTDEVILNMAQYSAGMYTVRVMTENGVRVERVSVVR